MKKLEFRIFMESECKMYLLFQDFGIYKVHANY
jgi:hypothetical protein